MNTLEIYGTFGPTCCTYETIRSCFEKGMTGMRLNLSHANIKDHVDWLDAFHKAAKDCGVQPDLLIDMKGPELRLGVLDHPIECKQGQLISFEDLFLPHTILPYVEKGVILLIDDGRIEIQAQDPCVGLVTRPGTIQSSKSVALPGVSIHTPVLTQSDIENLKVAKEYGVTGIMQPFVRNVDDLMNVKKQLRALDLDLKVYAKIENEEGVQSLSSLFPYCDQIIIARGDLANAVGLVNIAHVTHTIAQACKEAKKPYMVVTQMLYTMQQNAVPTRAEVSDIYYAVYHGASSIMLTGETAASLYPTEAMDMFVQVAKTALQDRNGVDQREFDC